MLDVQLTEYGKHLLSKGKLKPAHYSFFDDEILYNSEYAGIIDDAREGQNNIDLRIRRETPNLKVIPTRTGAETRVNRFITNVESSLGTNNSEPVDDPTAFQQQYFIEKVNFSSYPIGTGDMSSDKSAVWAIGALKNTVVSASEHIITSPTNTQALPKIPAGNYDNSATKWQQYSASLNSGVLKRVPQLNIEINYQTYFEQGSEFSQYAISDYLSDTPGSDNIYLSLIENYLVLDIVEENTNFEKENYDVEVFFQGTKVVMDPLTSQPVTNPEDGTSLTEPAIQQMTFLETTEEAYDYLDSDPRPLQNGQGDVEYYFDLYLDDEIPDDILDEIGTTNNARGQGSNRFRFNRDLYQTPDEDPC